jgi:hypothetical protein
MSKIPAISWGNHMEDPDLVVLRVDEGQFLGTIWSYTDVGPVPVGDGQFVVNYQCDFMLFVVNGVVVEEPSAEILRQFYDEVGTPVLEHSIETAKAPDS